MGSGVNVAKLMAKLLRWLTQLAAGVVILLALLVGAARLLLPEAASFAADIRAAAKDVSGFDVNFDLISAGVSLHGPELRFYNVTVDEPGGERFVAFQEAFVALDVVALLTRGSLQASRIYIDGSAINAQLDDSDEFLLQGFPWQSLFKADTVEWPQLQVTLRNIQVQYTDADRSVLALVETLDAQIESSRLYLAAEILPTSGYGGRLKLQTDIPRSLIRPSQTPAADTEWRMQVSADDIRLAPWLLLFNVDNAAVVDSGGAATMDIELRGMQPQRLQADVELVELLLAPPGQGALTYQRLAGKFEWKRITGGWSAQASGVQLERNDRSWPETEFTLQLEEGQSGRQRLQVQTNFLRLEDLSPALQTFAADELAARGITGVAAGDVWSLSGWLAAKDGELLDYDVRADFAELGYVADTPAIDIRGVSGQLVADSKGGTLQLACRDARFSVEQWFSAAHAIESLDGVAVWRNGPDSHRLLVNKLNLTTPDGMAEASFEVSSGAAFADPQIDLTATASVSDLRAAVGYLPAAIPLPVREWLAEAIRGGRATDADFVLRGPLSRFPFRNDEGVFRIGVDFNGLEFAYAPDWPLVESASGRAVFEQAGLYSTENRLTIQGIELQNVEARIADLAEGEINLLANANADLGEYHELLLATPVAERLGAVFSDLGASGSADADLELLLPIRRLQDWQLTGQLTTREGSFWLPQVGPRIDDMRGTASFKNTAMTITDAAATVLGEPVSLAVTPLADVANTARHRATLKGEFSVGSLAAVAGISSLPLLDGRMVLDLTAVVPVAEASGAGDGGFELIARSDLVGVTSEWPYPLKKSTVEPEDLHMSLRFPQPDRLELNAALERGISLALELARNDDRWRPQRGAIVQGSDAAALPVDTGIEITGSFDHLSLSQWLEAFAAFDTSSSLNGGADENWQRQFGYADLQLKRLSFLGYSFNDVAVQSRAESSAWNINVSSPLLEGRIRVPFDPAGNEPLEFDLSRLHLSDSSSDGASASGTIDPRKVPPLLGQIDDFVLGPFGLGTVEADVRQTEDGLRTETLVATAPSFELQVAGDWLVVDNAQRSRLRAELDSSDFAATLETLGYTPLIEAESARIDMDLLWEGGPGTAALLASTGQVDILLRDGKVRDVEAGGGRILGLLSVTSLPRRLALDFSDITDNTLEFDKISGQLRMDFGDAWTCNLALEGEVADLVVIGRTGIAAQDYDQIAAVRPHVSNLMPATAAFLGGPTVGVAALLVTQLFRKPLSNIGESYYRIGGSWTAPEFTSAQRSELDTAAFADCERQLPNLSPEELAAFEELASDVANDDTTPSQSGPNTNDNTAAQ